MARKKKKKKKSVSRPSLFVRLIYLIGRILRWLISAMMRGSRRNPLLAFGLALFIITFTIVSFNAFFRQPAVHREVFFSTRYAAQGAGGLPLDRSNAVQPADPALQGRPSLPAAGEGHIDVQTIQQKLAALQKELAALGLYQGAIDGLSGPRTNEAIRKWQQLQKDIAHGKKRSTQATDSIGAMIRHQDKPGSMPAADKTLPPSKDTVRRVQGALRQFGSRQITANGVMDHTTESAVRAFQARFGLPVSGKIDMTLTDKMREIGLLE